MDVPEPELISSSQLKIQLKATGVNPIDTKLRARGVFLPEAHAHHGEILESCGQLIEAGRLRIDVAQSLPLEQAVEAHRVIEAGHALGTSWYCA